jgi:thioredoxin 1
METKNKSFGDIVNSSQPVLVDFSAEWCGPCKIMSPILHEVKATLGARVTIIKVDVDKHKELAVHYEIKGVPTLMIFKNGNVLWRQSGVIPAKQIESIIQQFL